MTFDPELDTWRQQWQTRDRVPADVRHRVERDIHWKQWGFRSAGAVTVIFGGGTTAWALACGDTGITVLAVATWVFIAVTWTVSLTIEGGLGPWTRTSTTTAALVEFSIARRIAARRGIVAATVLYPAFSAFMPAWSFQNPPGETAMDVWSYLAARWRSGASRHS